MRRFPERCFRTAKARPTWLNAIYTLIQTAAMWFVFLAAIPNAILQVQTRLGVPRFEPGWLFLPAIVAFWLFGLMGIYCGFLFVRFGGGTPLPLDQTTTLVIRGPYRHVRNPMAVFGILQGVCVGLAVGSWPVCAYALFGIPVWHVFARPFEEKDLADRHGESYLDYRRAVRNWLPKWRPYPRQ